MSGIKGANAGEKCARYQPKADAGISEMAEKT